MRADVSWIALKVEIMTLLVLFVFLAIGVSFLCSILEAVLLSITPSYVEALAQDKLGWLDSQLEGREFIGGSQIGMADILLFCFLAFGANVGQPLNPENANVSAWFERMQSRPSAAA